MVFNKNVLFFYSIKCLIKDFSTKWVTKQQNYHLLFDQQVWHYLTLHNMNTKHQKNYWINFDTFYSTLILLPSYWIYLFIWWKKMYFWKWWISFFFFDKPGSLSIYWDNKFGFSIALIYKNDYELKTVFAFE